MIDVLLKLMFLFGIAGSIVLGSAYALFYWFSTKNWFIGRILDGKFRIFLRGETPIRLLGLLDQVNADKVEYYIDRKAGRVIHINETTGSNAVSIPQHEGLSWLESCFNRNVFEPLFSSQWIGPFPWLYTIAKHKEVQYSVVDGKVKGTDVKFTDIPFRSPKLMVAETDARGIEIKVVFLVTEELRRPFFALYSMDDYQPRVRTKAAGIVRTYVQSFEEYGGTDGFSSTSHSLTYSPFRQAFLGIDGVGAVPTDMPAVTDGRIKKAIEIEWNTELGVTVHDVIWQDFIAPPELALAAQQAYTGERAGAGERQRIVTILEAFNGTGVDVTQVAALLALPKGLTTLAPIGGNPFSR